MTATEPDPLEPVFVALEAAIERDPALAKEFRASRELFGPGVGGESELAARRHLEWFLLEKVRPGPDEARIDALIEQYTPDDLQRSLAESTAGVFEVTRVDPGRGVSLWDLAALHEYAVDEALGSQLLRPGDLIAGRIFPVAIDGAPLHRLSRAAAMWRDPRLLAAVKKDLEHAREMRPAHLRGTLRLRQSEIEAMFHTAVPQTAERADPSASGDQPVADARAVLEAGGLHPSTIEAMLGRLAREAPGPASLLPGASDALGEILEELAFESNVDLEAARRALLLAWVAIHANDQAVAPEAAPVPTAAPASAPTDVATAIAEFDRKRAEGDPLEAVFGELERDLGLADAALEDDEDTPAPDFPGVVGAMVEEFLWDEQREHGADAAARFAGLRGLGRFAEGIGVFENLSGRELTAYVARWIPESREIVDAQAVHDLLDGLERFCAWAQANHDVPLADQLAPVLASLHESLPRLVAANRLCAEPRPDGDEQWFDLVEAPQDGAARLREWSRGTTEAWTLDPKLDELLRAGDILRGRRTGKGKLGVSGCFPGAIRSLELA
jgi:hypothetical protein